MVVVTGIGRRCRVTRLSTSASAPSVTACTSATTKAAPSKSAAVIEPEFVHRLVEKLAHRVANRLAIFGWVRDHVYDTVMKAAQEIYEEGTRR
jgi:hypothetical protein